MDALQRLPGGRMATGVFTVFVLLALAGCAGLAPPGAGLGSQATAQPPLNESAAERTALLAEDQYVFEHKVPEDAESAGTGGVATPRALAVAATDDGWFVRVRFGFYYSKNTSEGKLHADGVTQTTYFVTPNTTTRVSMRGHEMKGSSAASGDAELDVRVVNAGDVDRDVSLAIERVDGGTVYDQDSTLTGRSSARAPRLSLPAGEYRVVATVDGTTSHTTIAVTAGDGPATRVGVFIAPDGTVVVPELSSHL